MQTITLFSKDYCPYGKAAKSLLRARGLPFNEIEVGNNPELLAYMIDISGSHSVPQIFFGDEHIGGFEDLVKYLQTQNRDAA